MSHYDVLHSPFDIETHKATFVNYLEVVILPNGTVEYAVPSHMRKLEEIFADSLQIDAEQVADCCPESWYTDYMGWLIWQTGAIPVWNQMYKGEPNAIQRRRLLQLKVAGLYMGKI